MQNKTVKLFALGALAAATTFGANAENTYDYFVGFDAGTRVSGKLHQTKDNSGYNESGDLKSEPIVGFSGGMIINNHHRVKFGLAYDDFKFDEADEGIDRMTTTVSYDYMLPIANKLSWTVGGHMGYEFFDSDTDELDNFTYGIQTGLDYKLTQKWSLGTEVSYTAHEEVEYKRWNDQIEDDVTIMANVQYHF